MWCGVVERGGRDSWPDEDRDPPFFFYYHYYLPVATRIPEMTLSDTAATTFTYFAAAGGGEGFILLATDSHLFFF